MAREEGIVLLPCCIGWSDMFVRGAVERRTYGHQADQVRNALQELWAAAGDHFLCSLHQRTPQPSMSRSQRE